MKESSSTCITEIGSVTQAMKSQEILAKYAIPAKIIKAEASRRGCVYALEYPCSQKANVERLLSSEKASSRHRRER
ncbi:MAG: DUF3343 domain-containing protein [Clostridia bacterium]|nr:DUF3343 domain-containing protein [Clostridia bacterium]MBO7250454.1 DUF3343 domain-containing protein [Clostridia bacterium]